MDAWAHLDRFLILGTEGGSYYVSERKMTLDSVKSINQLLKKDGVGVVRRIVQVSQSGRAPKNDPAIFALALAATLGNEETRREAFTALPQVCRTGTHLFQFVDAARDLRGWGRGLRRAVGQWYLDKTPDQLAYQVLKYRNREGWSHRDVLRLSHVKAEHEALNGVLRWAVAGDASGAGEQVEAFERLKTITCPKAAAELIIESRLPRECVPTELLVHPEVWEALLMDMPMTAMVRNLGVMSKVGLLVRRSRAEAEVVSRLTDAEHLRRARMHPLAVLVALRTYESGRGLRGSSTWDPSPSVVGALEQAFKLAFQAVEPAGKRIMLGLDVSGSMGVGQIAGAPVTPAEATAAMALVTLGTEPEAHTMAFASSFQRIDLKRGMSLAAAMKKTGNMAFGATDCAQPMLHAIKNRMEVDAFVVYTDNETWFGKVHPFQALRDYRQRSGIDAKLIVVGMTATKFTIADPKDPGMLDVVGFDSAAPLAMTRFLQE